MTKPFHLRPTLPPGRRRLILFSLDGETARSDLSRLYLRFRGSVFLVAYGTYKYHECAL
jgi:hypothetical protein